MSEPRLTAEQLRGILMVRLRLHAYDLVNGGANVKLAHAELAIREWTAIAMAKDDAPR